MRHYRLIPATVLMLLTFSIATAQENTSWRSGISVDFSAGIPFYSGDFDHPWSPDDAEYLHLPLGERRQYNTTTFSGSVAFPLGDYLSFRLRYAQATIYFSEFNTRVFFKNTIFDTSGLLQLHLVNQRVGWYVNAGMGLNSHFDANVYRSIRDMETASNFDRKYSMSTTFGTGLQVGITPMFSIFVEGDWMFTGSDRIDGWNGDDPDLLGAERSTKGYFSRDQILTGRAGVRFNLLQSPRRVEERSQRDLVSSYIPDPDREPDVDLDPIEEPEIPKAPDDDLPEAYRRLGIRTSLDGITIAVEYATGFDELERKRDVAERIASQLSGVYQNLEIFLLKDNQGYTVHFGTFSNINDARQLVGPLSIYYSGTQIRRH